MFGVGFQRVGGDLLVGNEGKGEWMRRVGGGVGRGKGTGKSMRTRLSNRAKKKHINFFNVNFLPPTQNAPFVAPETRGNLNRTLLIGF